MKSEIKKLIAQYQERIADFDILLDSIILKKRKLRKSSLQLSDDWNELCADRRSISAQRQCCVQFISDLESLEYAK